MERERSDFDGKCERGKWFDDAAPGLIAARLKRDGPWLLISSGIFDLPRVGSPNLIGCLGAAF